MDKYKLTNNTIEHDGITLYQIEALIDFNNVTKGMLGGYVASIKNLSQSGNAWVYGDAKVFGNAWVYGDAKVFGDARVCGNAWVFGDARVYGNAEVYGNAWVSITPKLLTGFKHSVTICDTTTQIGCENHNHTIWLERGKAIIKTDGISSEETEEMHSIITLLINKHINDVSLTKIE